MEKRENKWIIEKKRLNALKESKVMILIGWGLGCTGVPRS